MSNIFNHLFWILKKYSIRSIFFRFIEKLSHAKKCDKVQKIDGTVSNYYIAIVLIIKNEARYIREWLEYHKIIGIEHFFIYDNGSTDALRLLLEPYIKSNIVTYHYCPGSCMQIPAYNDAIVRYREKSKWLAFIDSDEFIVFPEKCNISSFLKQYEKYPALGVNWIVFDSNGFIKRPNSGFVLSNYTRIYKENDIPQNRHIKTIIQPQYAKLCTNPHFIELRQGFYINENFEKIQPPISLHNTTKKIQINHYHSKSKEEYKEKILRGRAPLIQKKEFNESDYNFQSHLTKKSNLDLSEYILKLKEVIPETYGPQYDALHSNGNIQR